MNTITLSESTFARLETKARENAQTPDAQAEELLRQILSPQRPYIEIVDKPLGPRAFIKGTRVSVSNIIAYTRLGETPESMTQEIMPHLTLAQVHDALSYYYDHRAEIDYELETYTEEWAYQYLREHLGEEGYLKITGQSK
ncbi:MAG: DUF433 domain-containing protein [Chloroflexi bacterium]|nr:DUF433 domain-containing protein [Chloroflexota bacterium]